MQRSTYLGGSLKAEGLGDGLTHRQSSHPQATLEAATRSNTRCHAYACVGMFRSRMGHIHANASLAPRPMILVHPVPAYVSGSWGLRPQTPGHLSLWANGMIVEQRGFGASLRGMSAAGAWLAERLSCHAIGEKRKMPGAWGQRGCERIQIVAPLPFYLCDRVGLR